MMTPNEAACRALITEIRNHFNMPPAEYGPGTELNGLLYLMRGWKGQPIPPGILARAEVALENLRKERGKP